MRTIIDVRRRVGVEARRARGGAQSGDQAGLEGQVGAWLLIPRRGKRPDNNLSLV